MPERKRNVSMEGEEFDDMAKGKEMPNSNSEGRSINQEVSLHTPKPAIKLANEQNLSSPQNADGSNRLIKEDLILPRKDSITNHNYVQFQQQHSQKDSKPSKTPFFGWFTKEPKDEIAINISTSAIKEPNDDNEKDLDYTDEETLKKMRSIKNIDDINSEPKKTNEGKRSETKVRFANMVEQVRFETYSSDEEEKVKPAIVPRGSSLGATEKDRPKISSDATKINSTPSPGLSKNMNNNTGTHIRAEKPAPFVQKIVRDVMTQTSRKNQPDESDVIKALQSQLTELKIESENNKQLLDPLKAENENTKMQLEITKQQLEAMAIEKENIFENSRKKIEGSNQNLKVENENLRQQLAITKQQLELLLNEKDKAIDIMDAQKTKFDKLSIIAYKKIRDLLMDHKILDLEVKSLRSQLKAVDSQYREWYDIS